MKNFYISVFALASSLTFAQQTISFEAGEGFKLGTLNTQNKWEVTEGSDGFLQNQTVSNEKASQGTYSFKNANEPDFDPQWFPIFGASKTFDTPMDYKNFTISYDVLVTEKLGADFEFSLYTIDENEEFSPVAGVGIENRGYIYLTKDVDYDFDYAKAEWEPNTWINVKIEVTAEEIKYYINGELQLSLANFTKLNIVGFNILHNNYGGDAYYDNIVINGGSLSTKPVDDRSFAVYPNPARETISINTITGNEIANVAVYNITGQKVLETNQSQNININSLATGAYILKATTSNGSLLTKKIIKN
jgi:hypothetical protein